MLLSLAFVTHPPQFVSSARYINFGAFCMQVLVFSRDMARRDGDEELAEENEGSIEVIGGIMEFLTFGLLLSFGGVAIKKAVVKAQSTDLSDLRAKVKGRTSDVASTISSRARDLCGRIMDAVSKRSKDGDRGPSFSVELSSIRTAAGGALANPARSDATPSSSLSSSPRQATPVLPKGWAERSTAEGKRFYFNKTTNVTTWSHPAINGSCR